MLPFDNIKVPSWFIQTHCQAGHCMTISQIAKKIYKKGGIRNFYSGSTVLAMGCIPAHGIYFSIYELMMERLGLNHHHHNSSYLYTLVGFTSSLFHDFILTPTEAIKQRLQLYRSE
jgi:solute carrier family 25 iron transporter 28/37